MTTAFDTLIAKFAGVTGLPLAPDEREGCSLETDSVFITIQYRTEADDVVIFAPVTDLDADVRPSRAMLEKALVLSYDGKGTSGASLGMFGGELILSVHLPMQGLDAEELGVKLTAFADAAVSARAEIASAMMDDGSADGRGEDDDGVGRMGDDPSQFIRV